MFNSVIDFSLRNRLLVFAASLLLLAYGGIAALKTPVDVFPDLNKPTVTLMTEAGGMAPEEVEQLVSFPVEAAMNGMPGVTRVRSVSGIGLSVVYVEFDWGSDIYRNRQQIAERLNLVREQLPPGIAPQMGPISSIMGEIALIAIPLQGDAVAAATGRGAEQSGSAAMAAREYADWVMRPRLLTVPGIAQVIPIGGELRQYRVTPDPAKLMALGITLDRLKDAIRDFSHNTAGGFVDAGGREYLIRNLGQSTRLDDLARLPGAVKNGQPVLLRQVAEAGFAAAIKRGDAGYAGKPAVILSVQKQPGTDTVKLTREVERALAELARTLPAGVAAPRFLFRQAEFIERSVNNVIEALRDGAVMVAVVLFLFLANFRTTLISLTAIPLSLLIAALVFNYLGLSINTMTLGGLAIAIGELVDDAVVDVENVLRRLRENRVAASPRPVLEVIAAASREVRSGVVYATLIVVLVFIPLFALPGIEGRLFTPLGIAYIVSILASMLVAMTLTPVLCYWLLPKMKRIDHGDSRLVAWLKRVDERLLHWSFDRARPLLAVAAIAVLVAAASVPLFPRAFLPPFNEGTLTVNVLLNPGTALAESNRIGAEAERLILTVPEVTQVGRRTGRAELDEHAEGVHYGELDVDLKASKRVRDAVIADIRTRLAVLPAAVSIGQPISHRLDHLLSGVRAQIALKIYGDDLDTLRGPGRRDARAPGQCARHHRPADRETGADPAVQDPRRPRAGLAPRHCRRGAGRRTRAHAAGRGGRPRDRRQPPLQPGAAPARGGPCWQRAGEPAGGDSGRPCAAGAAGAHRGRQRAEPDRTRERAPPHRRQRQYRWLRPEPHRRGHPRHDRRASHAAGLLHRARRPVPGAGGSGAPDRRAGLGLAGADLPGAVFALSLGGAGRHHHGQHPAGPGRQRRCAVAIGPAAVGRRAGRLHHPDRHRHAQWHPQDQPLHQPVRLRGRAFGRPMIVRGSLERLTPVLMTALVAAFALVPLLLAADAPGKEVLHPVAVVIFGGLVSSTLLDTLLTPVMFWLWGQNRRWNAAG